MGVSYLHLKPGQTPPLMEPGPFKAIIVAEEAVAVEWQSIVSDWLISTGCLFMLAWGPDSGSWDDSVDWAHLKATNFVEVPDEQFVMTTWHDDEPLREAFQFAQRDARHPVIVLERTLIVEIGHTPHKEELLTKYLKAQNEL